MRGFGYAVGVFVKGVFAVPDNHHIPGANHIPGAQLKPYHPRFPGDNVNAHVAFPWCSGRHEALENRFSVLVTDYRLLDQCVCDVELPAGQLKAHPELSHAALSIRRAGCQPERVCQNVAA